MGVILYVPNFGISTLKPIWMEISIKVIFEIGNMQIRIVGMNVSEMAYLARAPRDRCPTRFFILLVST